MRQRKTAAACVIAQRSLRSRASLRNCFRWWRARMASSDMNSRMGEQLSQPVVPLLLSVAAALPSPRNSRPMAPPLELPGFPPLLKPPASERTVETRVRAWGVHWGVRLGGLSLYSRGNRRTCRILRCV